MTGLELGQDGDQGGGLGPVPFEQVHLEREAARVDQEPDLDLRVDPVFLAHPDPAQVVLVGVLEVQRRHVVHDEGGLAGGAGRVRQARLRQLVAVVPGLTASQTPVDRVQRRRARTDLGQHAHRVGLARRLDDPRQHHSTERLIAQRVEPQPGISAGQDIPQQQRRRRDNPAAAGHDSGPTRREPHQHRLITAAGPVGHVADPCRLALQHPQVEDLLPRTQPLPRGLDQQLQLSIGMSRAHMVDLDNPPALASDDLDRDRTRGRAHLPHEPRRHPPRLPSQSF